MNSNRPSKGNWAMSQLELPEIETLRRDLERDVVDRKVKKIEVKGLKSLPIHKTKKQFTEPLIGAKVAEVDRVGLAIVLTMNNEHTLVIQLGEDGRLERCASKVAVASDVQVTITFTQGGDLRIADKKGSSAIAVVPTEELDAYLPDPADIGLDLLTAPISWIEFGRFVLQRKEPLKVLLMDDSAFVGIGAIYSDEILFDAGLRYDRKANELTTQEVRRLYRSVVGILHDAIKYRGTSLESRPFIDLTGAPGEFADHLSVYDKAGQLSPRSRLPIEKAQFKGKPVYFCSTQV